MMHHLKLIKALSYCGVVSATIAHPDVLVDDEEKYKIAMASGYFEEVQGVEESDEKQIPDQEEIILDDFQREPDAATSIDGMTIDELRAYATVNGIDLGKAKNKDAILAMIKEAEKVALREE